MLMKKTIVKLFGIALIGAMFISCNKKEEKAVEKTEETTAKVVEAGSEVKSDKILSQLGASGATSFIQSEEDVKDYIMYVIDAADDYTSEIMGIEEAMETIEDIDFEDVISESLVKKIEKIVDQFEDLPNNKDFQHTGEYSIDFDEQIVLSHLPAGLNITIPVSKANASLKIKENMEGVVNGNAEASYELKMDGSKLMGKYYKDSILKEVYSTAAVKAKADGVIKSYATDYEEFLEEEPDFYNSNGNAEAQASFALGFSFCNKEKKGGKAVISVTGSDAEKLDFMTVMGFVGDFEAFTRAAENGGLSSRTFGLIPGKYKLSVKFYDDDNKETFTWFDTENLYDIYSSVILLTTDFVQRFDRPAEKAVAYDYDDYGYCGMCGDYELLTHYYESTKVCDDCYNRIMEYYNDDDYSDYSSSWWDSDDYDEPYLGDYGECENCGVYGPLSKFYYGDSYISVCNDCWNEAWDYFYGE